MEIIEISNLQQARELLNNSTKPTIVTNTKGTEYFLGINVIAEMFNILQSEYPDKIASFTIYTGTSLPAFLTAKKKGFENIISESQ